MARRHRSEQQGCRGAGTNPDNRELHHHKLSRSFERLETELSAPTIGSPDSRRPRCYLLYHIRQQAQKARTLDRLRQLALFLRRTAVMRLGTILPRSET